MEFLVSIIGSMNNILWSYVLIVMLVGLGGYFTIKTGFVQFRYLKDMFKTFADKQENECAVSPFQAFCISTASRVGTGNLAGVAMAIALGGPGAVFWMWMITFIGAASSFVESTLAQIYKVRDNKNGYRGGPAYYMERGLKKRWMGITFSVLIITSFGLVFNSVQANTITFAFEEAFGVTRFYSGIGLTLITAVIIYGGVHRIAKVTEVLVPVMGVAYIGVALYVVVINFAQLPAMFALIFKSAFNFNSALGGGIGAAVMQGIKRGLFTNEAGMGSAPNAAATASTSHPVKQGFIQTLGVFTTTLVVCSATAFIILLSGQYGAEGLSGIALTQSSLASQVGNWAYTFVAVCIFLFAFSSIVGNYYYGETNIEFMETKSGLLNVYRVFVLAMVMFGSIAKVSLVWNLADLFMGVMAVINLVAIALLFKVVLVTLKDYATQRNEGKNPVFNIDVLDSLDGIECWDKNGEIQFEEEKEKEEVAVSCS